MRDRPVQLATISQLNQNRVAIFASRTCGRYANSVLTSVDRKLVIDGIHSGPVVGELCRRLLEIAFRSSD